jgi:hypothetical protein
MVKKNDTTTAVTIRPPNIQTLRLKIKGTAPLVLNRFSVTARTEMVKKQEAGSTGAKGRKREGKDFDARFREACYVAEEGWYGINASAFRRALISACRLVGFKMTHAKLSLFVVADGVDALDPTFALVRIESGPPVRHDATVRLETGVADVRPRPMWREWACTLTLRYDADQFTAGDVVNLLARVGEQVGVGEGRPDSKGGAGMGWGTFTIVN